MCVRLWWQLLQAAKAGELGDVERLLGEGAEVNSADEVKTLPRVCLCLVRCGGDARSWCWAGLFIYRGDDGP